MSPNVAPKPTDQSCLNSIFKVPLQKYPARWRTLRINGFNSSHKKQANELSDKHRLLQTCSVVSVAMLLNQQERSPIKYCYRSSEIRC